MTFTSICHHMKFTCRITKVHQLLPSHQNISRGTNVEKFHFRKKGFIKVSYFSNMYRRRKFQETLLNSVCVIPI
jgi:hypothetical protein